MQQRRGFDFLMGRDWIVHNRVLEERLAGSTRWREFTARLTDVRPVLAGLGNIDRYRTEDADEPLEALSLRLFDPEADEWTIYWADSRSPRLTEQVRGRFLADGSGEFFGQELYRGEPHRLRFVWSDIGPHAARWEQAYFDEASGDWETNWVMLFQADRAGE